MHSFEVSLRHESVDRTTFSTWRQNQSTTGKLSTLSVPDEDYSRNASCTLNLISTFYFYDYSFTSFIIIRKHCCGWMYRVCIL